MPLEPNRVAYSPIIERPPIKWPNGARVALWIAPNVEHYEYEPEFDGQRDPWPRMPYPDVQQYSYRDYGNRVGFWRMLEVLDKHNIRCCVSLNVAVLEHYPEIKDAMVERNWDFMSHGIYNTRYLNPMSEEQEREFYVDCIETLRRETGKQLKGMLGPAISGTEATPDLMAEAGLIYHTDWMHDDQPVPIKVKSGKLISVPYSIELNDAPVYRHHYEGDYFAEMCKAQFDQLYKEGAESGRVMCIALHPYLTGQPHRVKYLDEVLSYIMSHEGVWQTTADDIAELCAYREMLEREAIRMSVAGSRGALCDQLDGIVARMEAELARKDFQAYAHSDTDFHRAFFAFCGNRLVTSAFDMAEARIATVRTALTSPYVERRDASFFEHCQIVDNLRQGDIDTALALLADHIDRTRVVAVARVS